MTKILYLCDHSYECRNSLFCVLNGGECDHTVQFKHSRTGAHSTDIFHDDRFRPVNHDGDEWTFEEVAKNADTIMQD